jgi:hypothetical protein
VVEGGKKNSRPSTQRFLTISEEKIFGASSKRAQTRGKGKQGGQIRQFLTYWAVAYFRRFIKIPGANSSILGGYFFNLNMH